MMKANQDQRIPYAVFENETHFPILDITHPRFNTSIDEQAHHLNCLRSARSIESLKKMPCFIKIIFVKMSNVDNSYLSGMRTLLCKLDPELSRGNASMVWTLPSISFIMKMPGSRVP